MKKILVTGGAGYIGSVLVRDLLNKGYYVRVFDSLYFGDEALNEVRNNPNFEFIHGDMQNIENYPSLLDSIDAVIHLAGLSNDPSCDLDPYYTKTVNVGGTRKLAKMCKEKGVKRFIFSSSLYVLIISFNEVALSCPLHPIFQELNYKPHQLRFFHQNTLQQMLLFVLEYHPFGYQLSLRLA